MPERMLRKKRIKQKVCGCNRHHTSPRTWGRGARHAMRAAEKHILRRELLKEQS